MRQLASASPSASALAKRSRDTCSWARPLSSFHCSWAESRSTGMTGSSNTPGNSSVPCASVRAAVPPVWVASNSTVAPLRPGEPACTWGAAAPAPEAAGGVSAGCEATRRPRTRPFAW
ncbi:hypothetical protein [Variovorax sp. TBS-050B]|uniref:hypothetical protein n=1 Tax=Variovorax sp. TBS-050B TaxID=2940551 RepID=UPI0024748172|nr:hypothetical protein [Variovorax sp. TBS-050B]